MWPKEVKYRVVPLASLTALSVFFSQGAEASDYRLFAPSRDSQERQINESSNTLQLRTQGKYISGSPIAMRLDLLDFFGETDRSIWDAEVILSTSDGRAISPDRLPLFNGRGSIEVVVEGTGDFQLQASVGPLSAQATVLDVSDAPRTLVSGALAGEQLHWSGVVQVVGGTTINPDKVLTIDAGTLILIDGDGSEHDSTEITVRGLVQSNGTIEEPVVFTATDVNQAWGRIYHEGSNGSQYLNTYFTHGGASAVVSHTNKGPAIYLQSSTVEFIGCQVSDLFGKVSWAAYSDILWQDCIFARAAMGPEHKLTDVLMEDSWSTQMYGNNDNDGMYFIDQTGEYSIEIKRGVIAVGDDDALDTLGATLLVEDYIIRDFVDKGVSLNGGLMTMTNTIVSGNDIGVSAKNPVHVALDHITLTQNGAQGLVAKTLYDKDDLSISWDVKNSILWDTGAAVDSSVNPDETTISYSTVDGGWPGPGNLESSPLFVDADNSDFSLKPQSPAVNAGDPESEVDLDQSRADQGAYTTTDDDNDGFSEAQGDCDDADNSAFPGSYEVAGSDNNCDGEIDIGTATPIETPSPSASQSQFETPSTELTQTESTEGVAGSPTPLEASATLGTMTSAQATPTQEVTKTEFGLTIPEGVDTETELVATPTEGGATATQTPGEPGCGGCDNQGAKNNTKAPSMLVLALLGLGLRRRS